MRLYVVIDGDTGEELGATPDEDEAVDMAIDHDRRVAGRSLSVIRVEDCC